MDHDINLCEIPTATVADVDNDGDLDITGNDWLSLCELLSSILK